MDEYVTSKQPPHIKSLSPTRTPQYRYQHLYFKGWEDNWLIQEAQLVSREAAQRGTRLLDTEACPSHPYIVPLIIVGPWGASDGVTSKSMASCLVSTAIKRLSGQSRRTGAREQVDRVSWTSDFTFLQAKLSGPSDHMTLSTKSSDSVFGCLASDHFQASVSRSAHVWARW